MTGVSLYYTKLFSYWVVDLDPPPVGEDIAILVLKGSDAPTTSH
jgi:hypothetical protein